MKKAFLRILTGKELKRNSLEKLYKDIIQLLPRDSAKRYKGYKVVHNSINGGHVYSILLKDHLGLEEAEYIVTYLYDLYDGFFMVQTSVEDELVDDGEKIDEPVGDTGDVELGSEIVEDVVSFPSDKVSDKTYKGDGKVSSFPEPKDPVDYKYILAWGNEMRSNWDYIRFEMEKAARDRAPINAIYKRAGKWITVDDITNPEARERLERMVNKPKAGKKEDS